MAEVLLFHHAQGQTPGFLAFADELRAAGHTVDAPDLYESKTFPSIDEGVGYAKEVGFETILERGRLAGEGLPNELVYAGFSLGVMPAQLLAQTRSGAKGALLVFRRYPGLRVRRPVAGGRAAPDPHDGGRRHVARAARAQLPRQRRVGSATAMTDHTIGSREEWQAAREELLRREKEHTKMADELAQQRRDLPWVPVEKKYRFETDEGMRTLAELFDGRSQLLVYHFMFGPSYEAGCPVCSSSADAVNGVLPHLHARDVTMLYVSRAPLEKLQAYKRRMGWSFPWVSSADSDFNFDFGVSYTDDQVRERMGPILDGEPPPVLLQMAAATGTDVAGYVSEGPGMSAFALADGAVYHTYSTHARGLEFLMGYYPILDRAPKGRDEEDSAAFWIRRHDEYS